MARQSITLPPEIHDIIIGVLAEEGDITTLKAAALTCKNILPTCRSHIFATLHLVPPPRLDVNGMRNTVADSFPRRLENLRLAFKSNPDLAIYVRELHYMVRTSDDRQQSLHSLLQNLTRVKLLVLQGTIHDAGPYQLPGTVDWPNLSPSLHTALKSIIHSSCFSELCLYHVSDFPVDILAGCINLSRLTVDSSDFQDARRASDNDDRVCLSSLTFMDYSSRAIRSLMDTPIIDFTQLTALNSFDKTANMVVTSLLDRSKSLKSFTCTVWDSFNHPFRDILKPHTLYTLSSFSAVILIPPWLGTVELDPLYDLSHEFDKWAENNVLEHIKVKIDVSQDVDLPTGTNAWAGLKPLVIRSRFPKLRTVSLKINLLWDQSSSQDIKNKLEQHQREVFQELYESDEVVFQFSVEIFRNYG
ncbi:hypothetical protein CPB84DRAFT_1763400 [Gymnopilus junonius]|uniref:Uncharacterized protein n=1 Tax=Gymnopilus junonius TaxID=109634 RepID=A0A9P5TTH4_GYMJU|nr:hypothetical protein CPB84DRAFT_1763400 [Gymnopilus junonius]